MILDRVSFYPELFAKEYRKATRHLHTSEVGDLNRWVNARGFQVFLNEHVNHEEEQWSSYSNQ
jgi:hypothetical protein